MYGHPQNRFWKVIAALFNERVPETVDEKKKLILGVVTAVAVGSTNVEAVVTGHTDLVATARVTVTSA